jgi:hypothetical protein
MMDFSPRITPEQAAELRAWVGPDSPRCSPAVHYGCTEEAGHYVRYLHNCVGSPVTVFPVCRAVIGAIGQAVIENRIIHCPHCMTGIPAKQYRVCIEKVVV